MVVYMGLSAGCTRTCSLDSVFTTYLSGAMTLRSSMSGFMFATPDINIGGGLCSECFEGGGGFFCGSLSQCAESVCSGYCFSQPVVGFFRMWVVMLVYVSDTFSTYS